MSRADSAEGAEGADSADSAEGAAAARTRWLPVVGLFFLAPICAEYLLGYDSSTGNWLELAAGLAVLAPLYGGSALLIREVVHRAGRGTATILGLSAAWGIAQAGLIDQSMFNPAYRAIPYWDQLWSPTEVPVLGLSAFAAWTFITGHVVFSLAAPIVIIESLDRRRGRRPWLSLGALIATCFLALAGALIVWWDQMNTDTFRISPTQAVVCLGSASMVAALALLVRPPETLVASIVLPPATIGAGTLLASMVVQAFAPTTWAGLALIVGITVVVLGALGLQSRAPGWTPRHRFAAAAGALLGSASAGWFIDPIGGVTTTDWLTHHAAFSAALVITIYLANRTAATSAAPPA